MNASLLTGIAAALRGGLQGYKDANAMQRQAALDELQRKKIEEDDALKRAALVHKSDYDANRLRLEAEAATAKAQGAQLAEEDRLRKYHASGWGVGNDPEFADLRGPYMALGDDYAKAPPGPKPVIDQYGVIDGANEWNQFDKPTRGQIEAQGDLILRDVAKRQAEINARKHSQEMEKAKVKATAVAEKPGPKVQLGFKIDDLRGAATQVKSMGRIIEASNRVAQKLSTGVIPSKIYQTEKWASIEDPDVSELRQFAMLPFNDYMKSLSGAAVTPPEETRLREAYPNSNDRPDILVRKAKRLAKIVAEIYADRMKMATDAGYSVGKIPTTLDTSAFGEDLPSPPGPAGRLAAPPPPPPGVTLTPGGR